ncbi:MAG: hypothetical protein COA33_002985 [Fluviicola sp.]|nr:hypothetical protein [Fluviicola sp.]
MKIFSPFFIVLTLFLLFSSCKKNKSITYPIAGEFGENIMVKTTGDSLSSINTYSLTAELGKKADLKVVITNQSLSNEIWFYTSANGWSISEYSSSKTQIFTSSSSGTIDLYMEFVPGPGTYLGGKCQVDIYENSDDVTKSLFLKW